MAKRVWRPATLDIAALATCLLGFIALIYLVYRLKSGALGTPRAGLLLALAMVCAPFYVAILRTPKIPYLLAPVIAIFLLYPIAAPHGVVYSTDPIFNFSFTQDIIDTGFWDPGTGIAFARTYSYYPIGNVFVSYIILNAPLPPNIGYLWIEPMLRLLAIPSIVYSMGRRLFGPRTAAVGVLLYLGTPSILFNLPVQQGFGTIFFGLSLLALVLLTQAADTRAQHRAQILFAVTATAIVMTHHLTSYVFAFWLAAVGLVILFRQRYRPDLPGLRLGILFAYFVLILLLYIDQFTYPIFFGHYDSLYTALANFIAPGETNPSGSGSNLGRTFALFEIVWLATSLFVVFLLAVFTIRRYRASGHHPFSVANALVAVTLIIITLPLLATPLNYVPLRINEYTGFVVTPFAGATLVRWGRSDFWKSSRLSLRILREKKWAAPAAVIVISAALLMGGNLAPLTFRMFFEPFPKAQATDSPLFLGEDSLRAGAWAVDHFNDPDCIPLNTCRIWGDQLAVDVFAGFGDMQADFGSSRLFRNTTLDANAWSLLHIGDYVAVDRLMLFLRPNFLHEGLWPTALNETQVGKFATDPHFALVYQDATFSVYRVMSIQLF